MLVDELMNTEVVTLGPADTVRDALRIMAEREIRHLPVMEDGEPIGIVSNRDLRPFLARYADSLAESPPVRSPLDTPVPSVMGRNVATIDAGSDVAAAIDLIVTRKVGALPVVSPGRRFVRGIVSCEDILRVAREYFAAPRG